jgi:Glycosyltransferase family 9 (heptosyltransferase)
MDNVRPSRFPGWVPTPARLSSFAWAARHVISALPLPDFGIYFSGGLGDDIMVSAVIRELKKRKPVRVWHLTNHHELFAGNADYVAVPADYAMHRLCRIIHLPLKPVDYPRVPPRHFIAVMCGQMGIQGSIDLRPYIMLTEAETRAGKTTVRPQIALQTSASAARYPMLNKEWFVERFQVVVDELRRDFDIVQVGSPTDPVLTDVLDLRGRTTARETAAILAASHVFIGLATGLVHLARAVECRSVIVYGGREDPTISGYTANENLNWEGACAPCWERNKCDYDRKCMQSISAEHVIAAVRRQAERYGTPLVVDRVEI